MGLEDGKLWIVHKDTHSDLKSYKDWRQMADWISQNDQRGTEQQFNTNTLVKAQIRSAGGDFESAVMRGGMYDLDDLKEVVKINATPGDGIDIYPWDGSYDVTKRSNAGELLTRIIAFLTMYWMSRIKPHNRVSFEDTPECKWAFANLEALEHGERIFPLQSQIDAFQADVQDVAPAGSVYEDRRPSVEAGRLFGNRRKTWW